MKSVLQSAVLSRCCLLPGSCCPWWEKLIAMLRIARGPRFECLLTLLQLIQPLFERANFLRQCVHRELVTLARSGELRSLIPSHIEG